MTKEKQLLLKELCNRLPYGLKCKFEDTIRVIDGESSPFYDYELSARHIDLFINHINFYIKPYLRPMSSMTEEEINEYKHFVAFSGNPIGSANFIDWLNKHHFDYGGLIEKDLALEAPEGMYKEEQPMTLEQYIQWRENSIKELSKLLGIPKAFLDKHEEEQQ